MHSHQVAPIVRLGHQFVACRQVHDQFGARQGVGGAWRLRCPQIFTNLDGDAGAAEIEQLVAPHLEDELPTALGGPDVRTGHEPAPLVELLVVRVRAFRHGAQDAPTLASECRVDEAAVGKPPRGPDDQGGVAGGAGQRGQCAAGVGEQLIRREEIFTGVAGDSELRRDDKARPAQGRCLVERRNGLHIRRRMADLDRRRHRHRPQKAMLRIVHRRIVAAALGIKPGATRWRDE